MWPDLAKFRQFGKKLTVFGTFWYCFGICKLSYLLWQFLCYWANFQRCKWPTSERIIAIWSHCSWTIFSLKQDDWFTLPIRDCDKVLWRLKSSLADQLKKLAIWTEQFSITHRTRQLLRFTWWGWGCCKGWRRSGSWKRSLSGLRRCSNGFGRCF